jgi:hypothetical protein
MYSAASPLDGAPQASKEQALAYIVKRGTDRAKAQEIVDAYWAGCASAQLDPVLTISQSIHETTNVATGEPFASWWASRPRCNMAGVGVTGETRAHVADGAPDWQAGDDGRDSRGFAFGSYPAGVLAHVVHLTAYRYAPGQEPAGIKPQMTAAVDPRLPALAGPGKRGNARALGDLDGRWAVPGVGYGAKIASIANAICAVAQDVPSTPATPETPAQREARTLRAEAEAGVPAAFRGALVQEGEADLTAFGGGAQERLAIYEKQRFHRLSGRTFAFLLDGPTSFEALVAANKVVLF